jgi:hypothetical protein
MISRSFIAQRHEFNTFTLELATLAIFLLRLAARRNEVYTLSCSAVVIAASHSAEREVLGISPFHLNPAAPPCPVLIS